MIAVEQKPWMWEMCPMTFADETDRNCVRWQWNRLLLPTVEMLGPMIVWSVGFEALGYPPTWTHTQDEADRVIAACFAKLKEKHKWH